MSKRLSRLTVGCVGAVVLVAATVACGSSSHSGSTSSSSAGSSQTNSSANLAEANTILAQASQPTTSIPQTVPLPTTPPEGKTIVYLYDGTVTSQTILASEVKLAAEAVGWNYDGITFEQSNPATLEAGLLSALVKHPTIVASAAQQYPQLGASVISAYASAKIPLIFAGQGSPLPANKLLIGNPGGPEVYDIAGKDMAAWFVAASKGEGKVLAIEIPALQVLTPFDTSFQQEMDALCPSCQIKNVNLTISQATGGQAASVVIAALQSNPGYKYVLFSDGTFASGITSALAAADLSDVSVAGYDMLAEQAADLRAGTEAAWAGLDLNTYGCEIMDLALRYVENAPGSSNDDAMPTRIFTHANIGSATTYDEPANVLQQFEKLWKVSVTQ
jgi:hypothetical protein